MTRMMTRTTITMIMMIPGKPFYVVNGFCDACRTLGGRTTQFSWWWQLDRDVYEDEDDDGDDEDNDDKDDDDGDDDEDDDGGTLTLTAVVQPIPK